MKNFMQFCKVLGMALVPMCFLTPCHAADKAARKPWLVIEMPTGAEGQNYDNFPRLLLMQISKAGMFRCVDRATYRTQTRENALGDSGDIEFKSAGYCISWVIRTKQTARGRILTVSLGYNNIGRNGNGELIKSEDVVVHEGHIMNGEDLLTVAAKKAARAILFALQPPLVMEVINPNMSMPKATVDYGNDFLSVGEHVYFLRKVERKGRAITRKIGVGKVVSAELDSSCILVEKLMGKDVIAEDDFIGLIEGSGEIGNLDVCERCNGRRKIKKELKCGQCNGQGKVWYRKRQLALVTCPVCKGRGSRIVFEICPGCNGTGKPQSSARNDSFGQTNVESPMRSHIEEPIERGGGAFGSGPVGLGGGKFGL